jgi:hypothetical protein
MARIGISQNGYPVYDNTDHFVQFEFKGRKFWAADDEVATVFLYWLAWCEDHLEPINLPVHETPGYDDWSWNVRPVRGQTTGYSNHSSATAIDRNSTLHPRGVRGTYSHAQRVAMADELAGPVLRGVLRAGEFYTTSTIDGMHFEINDDRAAVKAAANRIRENDVTKDDVKAAVLELLRDRSLIANTTQDGSPSGTMSVLDALRLGDFKDDRVNDQDKAEVKRDGELAAKLDALQTAVDGLIARLDTPPAK